MQLIVSDHHVTYEFKSESTLYVSVNVKEFLPLSWRDIWSLSDCNKTRTHNHLIRKWTFNHLTKQNKWLSWVVRTYLYGGFDCMLSSYNVPISEQIIVYIWLNVKELRAQYRRYIFSLSDCNGARTHYYLVCKRTLNHLAKLTEWLSWVASTYCKYLCVWLYVIIMSRAHFRVNPHWIFARMSTNSLLETDA